MKAAEDRCRYDARHPIRIRFSVHTGVASLRLCVNEPRIAQHGASAMLMKTIGTGSEQLGSPLWQATASILGPVVQQHVGEIDREHGVLGGDVERRDLDEGAEPQSGASSAPSR